jgi:hypothetical protein
MSNSVVHPSQSPSPSTDHWWCYHCEYDVFPDMLPWAGLYLTKFMFQSCLVVTLTNFTVEQLHKKLKFVEYLFRCSHNSIFLRTEYVELKPFGWKTWSKAEKRIAEQSQTKRCSHNSFFFELSVWSWNHLAEKREAKLKNMKQNTPKHPIKWPQMVQHRSSKAGICC